MPFQVRPSLTGEAEGEGMALRMLLGYRNWTKVAVSLVSPFVCYARNELSGMPRS